MSGQVSAFFRSICRIAQAIRSTQHVWGGGAAPDARVRSSGSLIARRWCMLIAAVVAGLVMGGEASGQSLVEEWEAPLRVVPFATDKDDVAVAQAHMKDGGDEFIIVTGWGTNAYGGVCIVTYKVDAETGSVEEGPVYFPAGSPATVTTTHKPTAIVVDDTTGDVYITGYSQNGNGDFDYILLKYDSELDPSATATGWAAVSPDTAGVRRFDGEGEQDDKAVSIVLAEHASVDYVVITGTSRGEDNNDIVTIAYNRDDGDIEWQDSYNGPGDGNDFAVKVAVVFIGGSSTSANDGSNILIGGTVWNGADGFDIVALRYHATGTFIWELDPPYNGPTDGEDICTDLVAISGQESDTCLFLCGYTPNSSDPAPGNTDYVTLAIRLSGDLSDDWEDDGDGDGVRVWNPGVELSDDRAVAIGLAKTVVVTGRVGNAEDDAGGYDIGTIAYQINDGDVADTDIYGFGGFDGIDVRAVAMATGTENSEGLVYITGWRYNPVSQDAPYSYLTLRYSIDTGLTLDATALLHGEGLEAEARHVIWEFGLGVFVTGGHNGLTANVDHVTVRYSQ